jgi:hypothetical protein
MTRHTYDAVVDGVYAVAHFGEIKLAAQANTLGISEARYRDLVDPARKPNFPAAMVAPQARAAHDYAVVRTIARDAGGTFVLMPSITGDAREIVAALGESLREMGEATALITTQLSDGSMTTLEAEDAIAEIDQAVEKIQALRMLLVDRASRQIGPRAVERS